MPNHFHLLIKQNEERSLPAFMQSITTRYVIYFNNLHKRSGALFEHTYKATDISTDESLVNVGRYICRNAKSLAPLSEYPWSSYPEYLEKRKTPWVQTDTILSLFDSGVLKPTSPARSFQEFVEYDKTNQLEELDETLTLGVNEK